MPIVTTRVSVEQLTAIKAAAERRGVAVAGWCQHAITSELENPCALRMWFAEKRGFTRGLAWSRDKATVKLRCTGCKKEMLLDLTKRADQRMHRRRRCGECDPPKPPNPKSSVQ